MNRLPTVALSIVALGATAFAQPASSEAAVRARLPRELGCVQGAETDLAQWRRLLEDARRQLESPTTSEAMRREAVEAVSVLEARIRETAEALLACLPEAAVPAEPEVADEPATPPLAPVSVHLRAGAPQVRSAGHASVDPSAVHRALQPFGREFDVCYEALAARHAIVRGTATLVMNVRGDGGVHGARLEGLSQGDAAFQRCVQQSLVRIGSVGRVRGETTLAVPLHLGPEG